MRMMRFRPSFLGRRMYSDGNKGTPLREPDAGPTVGSEPTSEAWRDALRDVPDRLQRFEAATQRTRVFKQSGTSYMRALPKFCVGQTRAEFTPPSFRLNEAQGASTRASMEPVERMQQLGFTRRDESMEFEDIFKACDYDLTNSHMNTFLLGQFLSPTGQLLDRKFTGLSAQSHKRIAAAVKRARSMGLLPYLNRPVFVSSETMN